MAAENCAARQSVNKTMLWLTRTRNSAVVIAALYFCLFSLPMAVGRQQQQQHFGSLEVAIWMRYLCRSLLARQRNVHLPPPSLTAERKTGYTACKIDGNIAGHARLD